MQSLPYTHPAVRDLAWSLGSPPLLVRRDSGVYWPDDAWFRDIHSGFHEHLLQLDQAPEPLLDTLARRTDRRLGRYFETLWHYWLAHNPRYRLLHANLPVRAGGRTLGEFDLIVADRHSGKTLHWEMALKFYLGQPDTAQAANWWGPARRDRLDLKTGHLLQHQLRLSEQPQAQALLSSHGIHIDEKWVIMKGRLFYPAGTTCHAAPGSGPTHLRGTWLHGGELAGLGPAHWLLLEKAQWLAPLLPPPSGLLDTGEFVDWWRNGNNRQPVCVAGFADGGETGRSFVVPGDWGRAGVSPCRA
jgi:uncharacterized protein